MRTSPRFLLILMMFLGILVMGLRMGDIWGALVQGQLFSPVQQVQASPEAKTEAPAVDAKTKPDDAPQQETRRTSSQESSSPESDLYKQMIGRRDQLDKRAQELDEREAFVSITEKRVDQKIKEMETMRTQIQTLLGQASAAQQAQLENLVKIYEIMKPKEAAKIFETLDMPILLGVVQKMKAARTAAVLAEMNPEKAKEITTALTKQDQLPQVK
ncbi:MAG: hypothetical protein PHD48_04215 [Alphaproteobacteria bacterium]|nr:hypothetical protein [Alphaproteobacteria bacterium]